MAKVLLRFFKRDIVIFEDKQAVPVFLPLPTERVGHQRHRCRFLIGKIQGFERCAFDMLNRFVWKTRPRMLVSKINAGRGITRNFFVREDKTPRCPRGTIATQSTHEFLWFSVSEKRVGAPTLQPVFSKIGCQEFFFAKGATIVEVPNQRSSRE